MSIEVKNISKFYGTQKALDSISFSIKKGEIVGFLGPNGAGKSTTMKILNGFISASEGEVIVNDINVAKNPIEAQRNIGYLPEHNPLYLDMYVREYLNFCASIHKVDKSNIESIIEKVGLISEAHKKIKQLSKGYRQRVGLAAAMLHNPEVLILDEPTTGLDPNQLVEIRNLIKEVGKDKTVLFSTHIMQEVEAVCDRVIVINKGGIVADKQLNQLKGAQSQIIEVEFDLRIEQQLIDKLSQLKSAENIFDNTWELAFSTNDDMRSKVFDFAQKNGLKILQLNTKNKNLESLFRELTS
ncbi:gliding motility-associated ABC transporter ATP-binding subunit GldA [Urechidicola croceus]|uniref:Gliding motility-associated ABC transporter ATP-binding subunit GldA n=1 Tax=Urechidicola croceus TaxID=1850246 RepID=A0A1D8P7I7_9FLAO|nr:gliding motility-associated ABC transporter ATP-binding subunit GldA [Urechidicola croceus]AOW20534.1 gliding motility-associated ABC transporter ATP-binding subunit GldA [Urechidicola croceus]